jgi:hypothetical protein
MGSLGDFSVRINRLAAAVEQGGTLAQRKVAIAVFQPVVTATPVGNITLWSAQSRRRARPGYVGGRARANWQVGLGTAPQGVLDTHDAGGQATISKGKATIEESSPGQSIWLSNNLPYITPLNEGHSHQAPAGFVELAILKGIEAAHALKILP